MHAPLLQWHQKSRALHRTAACAAWRCSLSAQLSLSPLSLHPGKMFSRSLVVALCLAGHTLVTDCPPRNAQRRNCPRWGCLAWGASERSGRQAIRRNIRDRNNQFMSRNPGCIITHRMCSKESSWCVCYTPKHKSSPSITPCWNVSFLPSICPAAFTDVTCFLLTGAERVMKLIYSLDCFFLNVLWNPSD